jgi:hypothetical protein
MFKNLRHEIQDYPFYPLSPAFNRTGSGNWWHKRLRELRREAGLDDQTLAQRLLAVEWFPYHSARCKFHKPIVGSQAYGFQLARDLIQRERVEVVGMRSKKQWGKADTAFLRLPYLKNPRNVSITRNNMDPGVFDRLLRVLREN